MQITREFRFFLRPGVHPEKCHNTWSGRSSGMEIAPYLELRLTIAGPVSKSTGYLCDIRDLDRALLESIQDATTNPEDSRQLRYDSLLCRLFEAVPSKLPAQIVPVRLEMSVSPQLSLTVSREYPDMILWTQQSEFSASHRLHCPDLSDEENKTLFGKCNNPAGHGHNYVVEVTLRCPERDGEMESFLPGDFERKISDSVIQRLDHKNLNVDVPEFSEMNPSVENIVALIWSWLEKELDPVVLHNVRLYETQKTWADCSG